MPLCYVYPRLCLFVPSSINGLLLHFLGTLRKCERALLEKKMKKMKVFGLLFTKVSYNFPSCHPSHPPPRYPHALAAAPGLEGVQPRARRGEGLPDAGEGGGRVKTSHGSVFPRSPSCGGREFFMPFVFRL